MTEYIAFCGLDCEQCEVRITVNIMKKLILITTYKIHVLYKKHEVLDNQNMETANCNL